VLKGYGPADVRELSILLAALMVAAAGLESTVERAEGRVRRALASGAGLEKLRQVLANQGGDQRVVDDFARLPHAPDTTVVSAPRSGHLHRLHAEKIGRAAMALGAGRERLGDAIDPGVGIRLLVRSGDELRAGEPVLELRHRGGCGLADALALAHDAIEIDEAPPVLGPLVIDRLETRHETQ